MLPTLVILLSFASNTPAAAGAAVAGGTTTLKCSDIRIRDPFIVPVPEERLYYLYGSTDANCWSGKAQGFDYYTSPDLQTWTGPFAAFRPPEGFWSDRQFWAPEVHRYQKRYFMFASFKAEGVCRGTQILVADSPKGPFAPHAPKPVTPANWESLDGTLYVDSGKRPWMVFCHEWVQIHDGEMCAMRLTPDLSQPAGEPIKLFAASEAPWVHDVRPPEKRSEPRDLITDGPFLYRMKNGSLVMLWSTFGQSGYAVTIARSKSGEIEGPWIQDPEPLFSKDGGHAMLFRTFKGQLMMSLHCPNGSPNERLMLLGVEEDGNVLNVLP